MEESIHGCDPREVQEGKKKHIDIENRDVNEMYEDDTEGDDDSAKDSDYIPRESDMEESIHNSDPRGSDMEDGSDQESLHNDSIMTDCENGVCPRTSDSDGSDGKSNVFPMLDGKQKKIIFQGIEKNSKGTSIANKLHACFYCEKLIANIARHLELSHKSETEVAKILIHRKKSKERRKLWEELVNKGDFAHNISVIESGSGIIIPKKRSAKCNVGKFVPCQHCKAFYKRKDMWKHSQYCLFKDSKGADFQNPVKNGRLLMPVKNSPTEFTRKVLSTMRDDDVKSILQSDHRILSFGLRLFEKHGHELHRIQYIAQKLRELGRLLLVCQEKNKDVKCLDDILDCKHWNMLVACVKMVCGYDLHTHKYETPSLALKIGYSIQKCARFLRSEGLKEDDNNKIQKAEKFLDLYETDWSHDISAQALTSLGDNRYNKPLLLPIVEDVVKLNRYLTTEVKSLCEKIKENFETSTYARLAQMCMAQVILFNRRRSGETERMTLKCFMDAEKGSGKPDQVVLSTLNEFEKNLCNTHTRVEIKGKRGRKVAVLLTDEMKISLKTLIYHRTNANVNSDLLFAKPGEAKFPYRGSDCLRKFSKEAEVHNSRALTSTKLRKQLATLAQILNLSETSQDILATFQGHDIRVHRQFYRLPEDTMQIAKVSKVLHSINNGTIGKYKGQDLDEIRLDDKESVQSETNSESDVSEISLEDGAIAASIDGESEPESSTNVTKKQAKAVKEKKRNEGPKARHKWTKQEKDALTRQFKQHLIREKVPGKLDCVNASRNEESLANYPWKQVKFAVKNMIDSKKRQIKNTINTLSKNT